MINLGGYRDVTWPDNWTAVTVDGSRSAQFEHTMVVTESGQGLLHCFQPINPSTLSRLLPLPSYYFQPSAALSGCELLTGRIGEPADRMIWNIDTFQR
jgi:hypothetical protein